MAASKRRCPPGNQAGSNLIPGHGQQPEYFIPRDQHVEVCGRYFILGGSHEEQRFDHSDQLRYHQRLGLAQLDEAQCQKVQRAAGMLPKGNPSACTTTD